jgi:hypothetical protein
VAIAGVTRPELRPCRISARKTTGKLGTNARIKAEAQIIPMPIPASALFQGSASIRAPPGIWLMTPDMVPTASAKPTWLFDQP